MSKIKILMSDDNDRLHQSCIAEATARNVELVCYKDWEAAQMELHENFEDYSAVILDGKGQLNAESIEADHRHAARSVGWLKEQRGKGRYIPTVIYSAYLEHFELFEGDDLVIRLFSKLSERGFEEVILFLLGEIKNNPEKKFRNMHPAVWSFSEKYFSPDNRKIALELYKTMNSLDNDFLWKKNTLDALRRLNEALVDTIPLKFYERSFALREYLNKINRDNPPRKGKANMGNRAINIIDFFNGEFVGGVPGPIFNAIKSIYYSAAAYATHNEEIDNSYYPSQEMVRGFVYSHFGCYHWFGQIIKK